MTIAPPNLTRKDGKRLKENLGGRKWKYLEKTPLKMLLRAPKNMNVSVNLITSVIHANLNLNFKLACKVLISLTRVMFSV